MPQYAGRMDGGVSQAQWQQAQVPAPNKPGIPLAVESLEKSVGEVDKLAWALFERLQPVMGPDTPQEPDIPQGTSDMKQSLSCQIMDKAAHVRRIGATLDRIIERLEL